MQTDTTQITRNNLDNSSSPYLLQHTGNPVWWQEWSGSLITYAAENDIPVFVSVGYSTCHWCHVMAAEAFSDRETADFLNSHFICIKIDREQRPDIDQFMMEFINRQNGSGGWPLNVFLTPSLRPVYALTYAPARDTGSMYSLLSAAEKVYDHIKKYGNRIPPFHPEEKSPPAVSENSLVRVLSDYYDPENGGFGNTHKFPPHCTLLYLLYQPGVGESPSIRTICSKTLGSMMMKGLNDHLQGGIFRYCVDNEWTIPHFEKMLYDQAMALWVYSIAYKVLAAEEYRTMAEKIMRCLNDSFDSDGMYISAHDADTDHHEGVTYLWSYDEIRQALTPSEFSTFSRVYHLSTEGNFDGLNHLIRKNTERIDAIEEKLLVIRKKRIQPSVDLKIVSGTNALAAIALIQAGRYTDMPEAGEKGIRLVRNILSSFWNGSSLAHSSFNGIVQDQSFLSDAASLLAAITFIAESDPSWNGIMDEIAEYLGSFNNGGKWIESRSTDFPPVYASWFDHPVPSGVSLAETALSRYRLLKGIDMEADEYRHPFQSDFYNINVMIKKGLFHVYISTGLLSWDQLPVNSIQVRGEHEQDCFMGTCSPLSGYG